MGRMIVGTDSSKSAYPYMQTASATAQVDVSKILSKHDRLIGHMARRFVGRAEREDLIQEGRVALLDAARRFDSEKGAQLWTYARKFVFASMLRCATSASGPAISIEDIDEEAEEATAAPSPEAALEQRECIAILAEQFSSLIEEERTVLRLRFVDELDVRAIAERLGSSKSDIDRISQRALRKLRDRVGSRL